MVVYVATWQHYENFMVLDVFKSPDDAIQRCKDEAEQQKNYPGSEPIIEFYKLPGGLWHGKIHPDNNEIGYFVYEKVVK